MGGADHVFCELGCVCGGGGLALQGAGHILCGPQGVSRSRNGDDRCSKTRPAARDAWGSLSAGSLLRCQSRQGSYLGSADGDVIGVPICWSCQQLLPERLAVLLSWVKRDRGHKGGQEGKEGGGNTGGASIQGC